MSAQRNQTKAGSADQKKGLKLVQKNPFQRLESPSMGTSFFLHVLGLGSFIGSYRYAYGWHFQYLTIIGLTLATLTFIVATLSDLTKSSLLFRVKNYLTTTSLPMSLVISTLYWSLRAIDPSLVVPPELELPLSVDLGFHAVPALVLLLDLLFLSPPWAITAAPALILSTVIAFGYWYWIELCFSKNGFYPYPIFELLDTKGRVGLFAMSALLMTATSVFVGFVYRVLNRKVVDIIDESGSVEGKSVVKGVTWTVGLMGALVAAGTLAWGMEQ